MNEETQFSHPSDVEGMNQTAQEPLNVENRVQPDEVCVQPTDANIETPKWQGNMAAVGVQNSNPVSMNPGQPQFQNSGVMTPVFQVTNNGAANNQYNFWQHQSVGAYGSAPQNGCYNNQPVPGRLPEKKKKEHVWIKRIGKGLTAGIAAGIGFCLIVVGANQLGLTKHHLPQYIGGQNNTVATTVVSTDNNVAIPNDVTTVVDKCMPSIVSITSTVTSTYDTFFGSYDEDSTGSGSGIVLKISDEDILIVTNNHVIDDAKKIVVGFYGADSDEDMVEAVVKGTDRARDLAVVLVKKKDVPEDIMKGIIPADLGSSDDARVGEMAIAIGNSLGYGQSLTVGYISAKDRKVEIEAGVTMELLQTDAAINPGNSGGALLNAKGQLIGINSAKYADTTVEGMGFAIPISDAVSIINELMEREILSEEEKGYLGISGRNITVDEQEKYSMPLGVYVVQVSEDGAAYASDIVVGDIIVGIDDMEILTIEELAERINSYRIGTKLTLKVMRYEKGTYVKKDIKVELKGKETLDAISGEQQTPEQKDQGANDQQNRQPQQQPKEEQNQQPNEDSMDRYFDFFFGN